MLLESLNWGWEAHTSDLWQPKSEQEEWYIANSEYAGEEGGGGILWARTKPSEHTPTVKSCIKAAAYVHFFDFSGRLLYETGLYSKTGLCTAVVQLLAAYTVQSMHAGIQHSCVLYMTSHTINSIKSRFCKPWLLFESGLCVCMQLQKCGFYSRAASIQGRLLYKTLRYVYASAVCKEICSQTGYVYECPTVSILYAVCACMRYILRGWA